MLECLVSLSNVKPNRRLQLTWSPDLIGGRSEMASRIVKVLKGVAAVLSWSNDQTHSSSILSDKPLKPNSVIGFGIWGKTCPGAAARMTMRRRLCGIPKWPACGIFFAHYLNGAIWCLPRVEFGLFTRWITGCCCLASHQSLLHFNSPECNHCQGDETPWHLLQECPAPNTYHKLPIDNWRIS